MPCLINSQKLFYKMTVWSARIGHVVMRHLPKKTIRKFFYLQLTLLAERLEHFRNCPSVLCVPKIELII